MPAGVIGDDGMAGDNSDGTNDRLGTSASNHVSDRATDAGLVNSQGSVTKGRLIEQVDDAVANGGVRGAEWKPLQMAHREKLFRRVGGKGALQDRQRRIFAGLAQV